MGKGKDLWDDSALLIAFDDAISKYKSMHALDKGEGADINRKDFLPTPEGDGGSSELFSNTENLQVGNEASVAVTSEDRSAKTIKCSESTENPSSACCPNSQQEYNKLLENYYDIDYQRQIILQQLYQYPISGTSDPAQCEVSPQQFSSVSCYCPYGCQNWVVPCNSSAAPCTGDTCIDKSYKTTSDAEKGTPKEGSDLVKSAMDAAKTALASLKIGTPPTNSCLPTDGGKETETRASTDGNSEGSVARTDLADVLNAWYTAGFYTGKYLSEQSFDKRKHH